MYNSSNPFPSSIHGFPPPSSSFYYHHHLPFVAGDCSTTTTTTTTIAPPLLPITKVSEDVQCCDNINNHNNHFSSIPFPSKKNKVAGPKKDRHSKIFTAQGPRDRRVRLSIDISRKFFGLQDLLGFDKASKTLDWLFTKSKTAIKDLVEEMKQQHTSSSTLTDQCEEAFMGKKGDHNIVDKTNNKGSKKPNNPKKAVSKCVTSGGKRKPNSSKKATLPKKPKGGFHPVSLEARTQLRAEARARARERTIEKMQKVLRNDQSKNHVVGGGDHHHQNYCYQVSSHHQEVKIGESAAIEQKLQNKPYSLLYTTTH